MKKHCCKKRGSDTYQKSNYATFYMKTWQHFCILTAGFTKSCHSKRSLKAVNNTPAPQIWRFVTCQNCQMICKPYCWDKQHANMSPHDRLNNDYALLPENSISFLWVFLTPTHRFYQHETIFVWYCWIVTNTFKEYIFQTYQRRQRINFFEICLRRLKDVTWKTSFFSCICLKMSQKKHLFRDVFETS